jgi:ATP-dependent RNA helicase RhlE
MFKNLNLSAPIVEALNAKGYHEPTPIQKQCIPIILQGKDLFGCAQTGTGKTAAFGLPILQLLSENNTAGEKGARALILAPTRELALQISQSFIQYGSKLRLKHAVIFGGVSQVSQVNALRSGVDIIVATPGRLLDLMQQGHVKLHAVKHFVLDEADRMLDMGFINDMRKIIAKLPQKKQTMLFSATAPAEIMKLADSLLHNAVKVSVDAVSSSSDLVSQEVYHVKKENKRTLLKHVLKNDSVEHALVFTRTKRGADRVAKELSKNGIKAEAIHGNKSQGARERTMKSFKNRSLKVLVATDIASRGIDVARLSHVINFEMPEQAETYVHRIGRTGRAGSVGTAISFCSNDELPYLKDIQKLIRKNIEVVKHPY